MSNISYVEETLVRDREIASPHFELEVTRSREIVGPYGAYLATMAPPHPDFRAQLPAWRPAMTPLRASTPLADALDVLALLPVAVWKRVALYSFLFMPFGNGLTCGGMSASSNVLCAALVALGVAGLYACAQRNP
jgi:hypothetical protein